MSWLRPLRRRIGAFAADTSGLLSVEAAIMVPTLVFMLSLLYTTFDIFRYDATNARAAYTVADLLSRETDPVNQGFIDGMKNVYDYITLSDGSETWVRVTVVRYDDDDEELKLLWSHVAGTEAALTTETLATVAADVPDMADEDTVIVVETFTPYHMPFNVGIADFAYRNVIVTRPRFAAQLLWTNSSNRTAGV